VENANWELGSAKRGSRKWKMRTGKCRLGIVSPEVENGRMKTRRPKFLIDETRFN
jgi:hypothetical protein